MSTIFNIGVSSLIANQTALNTTGNNISNANTEGYSRQRVEFAPRNPQLLSAQYVGRGVNIENIDRVADQFLVGQLRSSATAEREAAVFANFTRQVNDLLGDAEAGLSPAIQGFFEALQDANNDPSSSTSRQVLLGNTETLVARFNDMSGRLGAYTGAVNSTITAGVADINALSASIAELNKDIIEAQGRGQGASPSELLDQRDRLLQALSEQVAVTAFQQDDGAVNVTIGNGQLMVAGARSFTLAAVPNALDATRLEIAYVTGASSSVITNAITGGELSGALEFRDTVLEPARNSVGRLAATLTQTFNAQHREGMDLNGALGGDYFATGAPLVLADPANAGSISVAYDPAAVGALTTADYRLAHDGTDFTLTNTSTNAQQTLAGAGPFAVDGMTITVTGAPAAGDVYELQPTKDAARTFSRLISQTTDIALAVPVRTGVDLGNIGSGRISAAEVLDVTDAALLTPVTLQFADPPTAFQLNGAGPLIPYVENADIDINGWRVRVAGAPEPGDRFTVGPAAGATGDNGNGLALADLQLADILDSGTATYQDSYGQLIGSVGTQSQQANITETSLSALRDIAQAERDSVSGVNLDEEAANLLRFQQSYQASAQVIQVANDLINTLLDAVRR